MTDVEWPPHLPRTAAGNRHRSSPYQVTQAQAVADLETEIDRLDPDDWRVSIGNQHTKSNGMPLHNANPDDPSFVLRWSKDGTVYAVGCDHYADLRDNVREVGKWIHETRMRDNRSVVTGGSNFAAAELPPGDDEEQSVVVAQEPPHEVLGVTPDADESVVNAAYRVRVKKAHPDNGGSKDEFKRVRRAKKALLS